MTEFILNLIAWGGYIGIFILMTLENVFPPIPSEVIMGLGGMAVARGDMDMTPLLIVATLGTTFGNMFWYGVGRWIGIARLKPFVERHGRWLTLTWDDVEKLNAFFHRHGGWVVFFFRFLPTFRTMISLPAGMAKMGLPRFLLATFVGSAIWNAVLAYAGLLLGSRFQELQVYVGPVAVVTTAAVVLVWGYRVVTWKRRER
ncbi:membrane protein DedA with SNARE-associated domain [Sphingomonas sp. BE123]|uniref:DedA family protein n=1 Tax=Sphingomonas sp. BE123 TaxID=2817842 RepID=UPI00285B2A71|nr:DedA family protein [Sphingomonas sp. BE123]MDR6852818.1 membrane protein DedA with SNARE-associated domain [Sphingomonas sp. BE123]